MIGSFRHLVGIQRIMAVLISGIQTKNKAAMHPKKHHSKKWPREDEKNVIDCYLKAILQIEDLGNWWWRPEENRLNSRTCWPRQVKFTYKLVVRIWGTRIMLTAKSWRTCSKRDHYRTRTQNIDHKISTESRNTSSVNRRLHHYSYEIKTGKSQVRDRKIIKVLQHIPTYIYLPTPSARAGYDTRSIFKRGLTCFNSPRLVALQRLKNPVCPTIYP